MKTLKQFCEKSHINPKLIRAVVRQIGGWESFTKSAHYVVDLGADAGYAGFIYYTDTCKFYVNNRKTINILVDDTAWALGTNSISMVRMFTCLGLVYTVDEVAQTLYGPRSQHQTQVANALAWFALEEVCRSYVDLRLGIVL